MMKDLPRLNEVMKHKGFGKPSAKIWFVGLEYHGALQNIRKMMNLREWSPYKNDHGRYEARSKGKISPTPTWKIQAKIATASIEKLNGIPWKEYLEFKQFRDKNTFLTNLFPLPMQKHNSWGKHYEEYVGGDKEHYHKLVEKKRWPILRNTAEKFRPTVIFCFGKTEWKKFFDVFVWGDFEVIHKTDMLEVYITDYDTTVILTPFFVPFSFSDNLMNKAIKFAKKAIEDE